MQGPVIRFAICFQLADGRAQTIQCCFTRSRATVRQTIGANLASALLVNVNDQIEGKTGALPFASACEAFADVVSV